MPSAARRASRWCARTPAAPGEARREAESMTRPEDSERIANLVFYSVGAADRVPGLSDRPAVPDRDRLGDRARDLPRARADAPLAADRLAASGRPADGARAAAALPPRARRRDGARAPGAGGGGLHPRPAQRPRRPDGSLPPGVGLAASADAFPAGGGGHRGARLGEPRRLRGRLRVPRRQRGEGRRVGRLQPAAHARHPVLPAQGPALAGRRRAAPAAVRPRAERAPAHADARHRLGERDLDARDRAHPGGRWAASRSCCSACPAPRSGRA